jgi:hypothetical protein
MVERISLNSTTPGGGTTPGGADRHSMTHLSPRTACVTVISRLSLPPNRGLCIGG